MPASLLDYRLRIRNASTVLDPNGTADVVDVSSVVGVGVPYIGSAPEGDGQEVDPVTGAVRTGSYAVEIVDAVTGTDATGTLRYVTNRLEDAGARQQLLGRRAYVEMRTNGGAWVTMVAGYVTSIRLVSAMRYVVQVGDTRRVQQTQTIFQGASLGPYTTRGTITGGPVTKNFGPSVARGGWQYRLTNQGDGNVFLEFVEGYAAEKNAPLVKDWSLLARPEIARVMQGYAQPNPYGYTAAAGARVGTAYTQSVWESEANPFVVSGGIQAVIGTTVRNATPVQALVVGFSEPQPAGQSLGVSVVYLYWPSCPHETDDIVYVSLTTVDVSEAAPLYLDAHPVDLTLAIWSAARITYDPSAAWIGAMRALVGENVRIACRFAVAPIIADFLESAVFGPFGISARTNAAGAQELFPTRIRTDLLPTLVVGTNDLRGAGEVVFDLDERTAVTSVTLEQQVMQATIYSATRSAVLKGTSAGAPATPLDGVLVSTVKQTATAAGAFTTGFMGRAITYSVPGMIYTVTPGLETGANWVPNSAAQIEAMAVTVFDRYGRGATAADVSVMAGTPGAAAQIGDELYFEAAHFPNKGYRIGESNVGARIMQVVRRTESPAGPVLRLLDSGLAAQPVGPVPVLAIAKFASAPTTTAAVTITNAAALNALTGIEVLVQYATGPSEPVGYGAPVALYKAPDIPSTAIPLDPVTPGLRVWTRARLEQPLRRPSSWSAWVSVVLDALPSVSALTVSAIRQTAATVTWTNAASDLPLVVYAAPGGVPADWGPYEVAAIPAGSTLAVVRSLTGPGVVWRIGVAYVGAGAVGPVVSVAVTTNATLDASARPAALAVIGGVDDVTLTQGVALAMWPSDQTLDLVVERSLSAGSGFAKIAQVTGATPVYVDALPRTGTTYYYRIAHLLGGFALSSYSQVVSASARGVPLDVVRPDAVPVVVQVETSEAGTTATVVLTITDPQGRVDVVRFRSRIDAGAWSAYTVDDTPPYSFSAAIPATGYVQIEYEVTGYDAAGVLGVLAGGVESFDANAGADMVSVVGTFSSAGALTLAFSGDTDTASLRFATSTSAQPTAATVQAQGPLNGRNITAVLPGPFASNATVFVSVLAYTEPSGGGAESVLFAYRFVRDGGLVYTECLATLAGASPTQLVVRVTGTAPAGSPTVQLVAVTGSATLAAGAAIGVPVASGSLWTFNRGAALGATGGAEFLAVLSASQSDGDFIEVVEQGRDTTYLTTRARVTGSTPTTVTVRYAVLDKYLPLSCGVTYLASGVPSVSPGSPLTVTAAVGDTFTSPEVAGSFIDYTITRPLAGAAPGRVTWTATASGRVGDSDAVDVPPQNTQAVSATLSFTAAGQCVIAIMGDMTTASIRYATSTSAWPGIPSPVAGIVANGRSVDVTLPGPFALGVSVYLSVRVYTAAGATGLESEQFTFLATRASSTPTVINRQPGTMVCRPVNAATGFALQDGYYVPSFEAGSTLGIHHGQVIIPRGVTLRAVRVNCYALRSPGPPPATGDIITINVFRVENNGTNVIVGTTSQNAYAGWLTLGVTSLAEDTTNHSYFCKIYANWDTAGPPSDLRIGWIETEYDKPNSDANI